MIALIDWRALMRTVSAVLALCALAACTGATPSADPNAKVIVVSKPKPGGDSGLPAPAIPGATVRITAEDAGKTITVPVGATFQVQLMGVPTAGYLWGLTSTPDFLEKTAETGGDTTTAQRKPGFVGGNHWEVFALRAKSAGRGELVLEQRRPWEKTEPPSQTFRVTIEAR
jgi:inhibitor of cysteine peptidase